MSFNTWYFHLCLTNYRKIDTKKKSSTPLQNISNFINERHSNKVVPKRTGAPFMWLSKWYKIIGSFFNIKSVGWE